MQCCSKSYGQGPLLCLAPEPRPAETSAACGMQVIPLRRHILNTVRNASALLTRCVHPHGRQFSEPTLPASCSEFKTWGDRLPFPPLACLQPLIVLLEYLARCSLTTAFSALSPIVHPAGSCRTRLTLQSRISAAASGLLKRRVRTLVHCPAACDVSANII